MLPPNWVVHQFEIDRAAVDFERAGVGVITRLQLEVASSIDRRCICSKSSAKPQQNLSFRL